MQTRRETLKHSALVAGLLATWGFHRWSRSTRRPGLASAMEDSMTGGSLRNARRIADEIARIENE